MRSRENEFKHICTNIPTFKKLCDRLSVNEIEECLKFIKANDMLDYDGFEEKRKRFAYERPIKTINISEMLELLYVCNLVKRAPATLKETPVTTDFSDT